VNVVRVSEYRGTDDEGKPLNVEYLVGPFGSNEEAGRWIERYMTTWHESQPAYRRYTFEPSLTIATVDDPVRRLSLARHPAGRPT